MIRTYNRPCLHMIDETGHPVSLEIAYGVIKAFLTTLKRFPQIDPCLIANWAEEVACAMQKMEQGVITCPAGMAIKRMGWKVTEHRRLFYTRDKSFGDADDLLTIAGPAAGKRINLDSKVLIDQLRPSLNERENRALDLLLDGHESTHLGLIMGLSHDTGRRLGERVKRKILYHACPDKIPVPKKLGRPRKAA